VRNVHFAFVLNHTILEIGWKIDLHAHLAVRRGEAVNDSFVGSNKGGTVEAVLSRITTDTSHASSAVGTCRQRSARRIGHGSARAASSMRGIVHDTIGRIVHGRIRVTAIVHRISSSGVARRRRSRVFCLISDLVVFLFGHVVASALCRTAQSKPATFFHLRLFLGNRIVGGGLDDALIRNGVHSAVVVDLVRSSR